ncbi:MAG: BrnT family toxin [Bryobacteraceae bacterium]
MKRGGQFEWDDQNAGHIALHNVTPDEVEQVIANDPISLEVAIRKGERRTVCAGWTDSGRVLKVVYTVRNGQIRVVTAHEDRRLRRLL